MATNEQKFVASLSPESLLKSTVEGVQSCLIPWIFLRLRGSVDFEGFFLYPSHFVKVKGASGVYAAVSIDRQGRLIKLKVNQEHRHLLFILAIQHTN